MRDYLKLKYLWIPMAALCAYVATAQIAQTPGASSGTVSILEHADALLHAQWWIIGTLVSVILLFIKLFLVDVRKMREDIVNVRLDVRGITTYEEAAKKALEEFNRARPARGRDRTDTDRIPKKKGRKR
jgi:hypothetical protein